MNAEEFFAKAREGDGEGFLVFSEVLVTETLVVFYTLCRTRTLLLLLSRVAPPRSLLHRAKFSSHHERLCSPCVRQRQASVQVWVFFQVDILHVFFFLFSYSITVHDNNRI